MWEPDEPTIVDKLRDAADRAFSLSKDRTGDRRHRLIQVSYRLDIRAHSLDAVTRCEENKTRHKAHKRDCDRKHVAWMKANGWYIPIPKYRVIDRPKLPTIPKRMVSAGKRFQDDLKALHKAMDWQRMTIWEDGNERRDYDKAEQNETTRPLLNAARAEFARTAKTCGLTVA